MNIVKVGQVYKNYKDLCNYLGETVKGGKSKELQVADWKRYFEFDKDKNKFIITNVYDEPLEKVTNHTSNNIKNIQPMIEYLQGKYDISNSCYYSMMAWYCECLGLLERNICEVVYSGQIGIEEYCNEHNISNNKLLCEYVSAAKSSLKDIFLKALKYMKKSSWSNMKMALCLLIG